MYLVESRVRQEINMFLELGRKEVRDNIFEQMVKILDSKKIDYIKWDMNRSLSDIYESDLPADQQGEAYHRYVLGYYDLLNKLVTRYPDILFEGCSGGGGRFDVGQAYYTHHKFGLVTILMLLKD